MSPPEMHILFNHINSFSELLTRKGYDGDFYDPYGFKDKIKDSVTKHVFHSFQEKGKLDRIELVTDSERKSMDNPYVRYNLSADYSMKDGFQVKDMNIEQRNAYGTLRHKEFPLNGNEQLPERNEATKSILEQKRSRKI